MDIYKKNAEQLYPKYVSKFIHERYDSDTETALINNYLLNPETYKEDYEAYQAYRAECKVRAKEILEMD